MNRFINILTFRKTWYLCLIFSLIAIVAGVVAFIRTMNVGLGVWNINNPVNWGISISNFVWWIGIGHAGTFISAILLLFRQKWRLPISRLSEFMTIVALICASIFPLIHLGRLPKSFFIFPYPNDRLLWVNFNSPLVWDAFAIGTYFIVSCIYWFIGLVPDLHLTAKRNRSKGILLLMDIFLPYWSNSQGFYQRLHYFQRILAGIATALVISVHSIVSLDFATSIMPGWHSAIFPPYFVIGAIFSGFAMVLILGYFYDYLSGNNLFTENIVTNISRLLIAMSILLGLGYFHEIYHSLHASKYEYGLTLLKLKGQFAPLYWFMIFCNLVLPQLLWMKKIRNRRSVVILIAVFILIGMWIERYLIVITSLSRDFISMNWDHYQISLPEITLFAGSIGLFIFILLIGIKLLPMTPVTELKILSDEESK